MSITPIRPVQDTNNYGINQAAEKQKNGFLTQEAAYQKSNLQMSNPQIKFFEQPDTKEEEIAAKIKEEDLEQASKELSEVVQSMGAQLNFEVHEKTGKLMVKMVDVDGNMLKEFPPQDFLDMVARIRDYIGALIDEKV